MPQLDTYEKAEAYLDSLGSLEKNMDDPQLRRKMRMERMGELLAAGCAGAGDPASLKVVHVAGTKGKGSVVTMLSAMLAEAGLSVGSYLSPHVTAVEERICLGVRSVAPDRLRQLLSDVSTGIEAASALEPTYFEVLTICAIRAFLEESVDIAVLEVGLGGRLDCTNALGNIGCAITSISIDHTDLLGDTISAIAREKAGIIKGGAVVSAAQTPEAMEVISEVCREKGSVLHSVGGDIALLDRNVSAQHQKVSVATWKREFRDLVLPLRSVRQHENVAVALGLLEIIEEETGIRVETARIGEALRRVRLPARIEFFPGDPPVVIDGSHNEASVRNLLDHIRDDIKPARTIAVFGMARDKKISQCLEMLCSQADVVILSASPNNRAASPEELIELMPPAFPSDRVRTVSDPQNAYRAALAEAGPDDLIVCLGSFYLAGDIRSTLLKERTPS